MKPFVVAIDFDGTIHDVTAREPGFRMGKPFPGAIETLTTLRELGARIVVHTCRARSPQGVRDPDANLDYVGNGEHVEKWLDHFGVPYDEVTALKPMAEAYVDDKAIPFLGDWASVERELLALYYLEVRS